MYIKASCAAVFSVQHYGEFFWSDDRNLSLSSKDGECHEGGIDIVNYLYMNSFTFLQPLM